MKIRPVGAELFHADRQTDMTKLRDAFHNFANAPKNVTTMHCSYCSGQNIFARLPKLNGSG